MSSRGTLTEVTSVSAVGAETWTEERHAKVVVESFDIKQVRYVRQFVRSVPISTHIRKRNTLLETDLRHKKEHLSE